MSRLVLGLALVASLVLPASAAYRRLEQLTVGAAAVRFSPSNIARTAEHPAVS